MKKTTHFNGGEIAYQIEGRGEVLLFLHGYLESGEIWNGFSDRFEQDYCVICMDIPGHGESDTIAEVHSMELMADAANAILEAEGITERITIIGHSMGGYVTMAFVAKYPQKIRGYCLFHSTCFADNEEKRLNRDREISLVRCGKKLQIVKTNIPKAFADENIERFQKEIERCKEVAQTATDDGIVALLRGMQQREDHSATLGNSTIHPLIIWGKKDNYIGETVFNRLTEIAPHASMIVLKNSGHMGFIEESDCIYSGIIGYLGSLR